VVIAAKSGAEMILGDVECEVEEEFVVPLLPVLVW
jgi:hypothetical protein